VKGLLAFFVLTQLALIAVAVSEHSRIGALAARLAHVELIDNRQETANSELELQINLERECINWLLADPHGRAAMFCNEKAIGTPRWAYDRPGAAMDKALTTERVQEVLDSSKSLGEAAQRLRQ
jgi:hypothetical protein